MLPVGAEEEKRGLKLAPCLKQKFKAEQKPAKKKKRRRPIGRLRYLHIEPSMSDSHPVILSVPLLIPEAFRVRNIKKSLRQHNNKNVSDDKTIFCAYLQL